MYPTVMARNLTMNSKLRCNNEGMVISDEQLDRFIATYKKLYGEELERQVAYDLFIKLINLYKLANKHIFNL